MSSGWPAGSVSLSRNELSQCMLVDYKSKILPMLRKISKNHFWLKKQQGEQDIPCFLILGPTLGRMKWSSDYL